MEQNIEQQVTRGLSTPTQQTQKKSQLTLIINIVDIKNKQYINTTLK